MRLSKTLALLSLALLLPALVAAPSFSQDEPAQKGGEKKPAQEKKPARGPAVPRLPNDRLPPQTRRKLDPSKTQFVKVPVHVYITEQATTGNGKTFRPEVTVVRNYLAEYFRRAGHPVVDRPEKARYRIEGEISTVFERLLRVRKETIGWKFVGEARIHIIDEKDRKLDTIDLPEVERLNVKSEKSAIWDLRRYLAHLIYRRLFDKGPVFAHENSVRLLAALTVDPFESEFEMTADEITTQLTDIGLPVVPALLDALTDTRVVLVSSSYPGLENPKDLKVYHIADKVLEEIFQKVSRMGIRTPNAHRFLIIQGWENEWRRFCTPFRESPEFARRKDFLHRKAAGAVEPENLRVLDRETGDAKKRGGRAKSGAAPSKKD